MANATSVLKVLQVYPISKHALLSYCGEILISSYFTPIICLSYASLHCVLLAAHLAVLRIVYSNDDCPEESTDMKFEHIFVSSMLIMV